MTWRWKSSEELVVATQANPRARWYPTARLAPKERGQGVRLVAIGPGSGRADPWRTSCSAAPAASTWTTSTTCWRCSSPARGSGSGRPCRAALRADPRVTEREDRRVAHSRARVRSTRCGHAPNAERGGVEEEEYGRSGRMLLNFNFVASYSLPPRGTPWPRSGPAGKAERSPRRKPGRRRPGRRPRGRVPASARGRLPHGRPEPARAARPRARVAARPRERSAPPRREGGRRAPGRAAHGRQPGRPEHARPEHARPEHARPEHARPEHARPEHARPEHARPEHARPEHARPEHARPEHARPEHARPEHARPEHARPARRSKAGARKAGAAKKGVMGRAVGDARSVITKARGGVSHLLGREEQGKVPPPPAPRPAAPAVPRPPSTVPPGPAVPPRPPSMGGGVGGGGMP